MATPKIRRNGEDAFVKYRGRTHKLFKRPGSACWYIRAQINGTRKTASTDSADLGVARERARSILESRLDEKWDKVREVIRPNRPAAGPFATIGQVLDVYLTTTGQVHERTARVNASTLLLILKESHGIKGASNREANNAKMRSLSTKVLTQALVRKWQAMRQDRPHRSTVDVLPANTSINSAIRQARSVFTRRMLRVYAEHKLLLPDLEGFLANEELSEPSHHYTPLPRETLREMVGALPAFQKENEPAWAIICMALLLGMRGSEIMRARKGWLRDDGNRTVIAIVKRSHEKPIKSRERSLTVPPELAEYFKKQKDFLVPRTSENDGADLMRQASTWLRKFIPKADRQKSIHELRKEFGSQVLQRTGSLTAAAEALGDSVQTARSFYVTQLLPTESLDFDFLNGGASKRPG